MNDSQGHKLRKFIFALLHPLWRLYDLLVPKRKDYWAFATHHLNAGRFIENQRALFEHVKKNPGIRKVIFYRGEMEDFFIEDAVNYEIVRHGTLRALALLARCKVVLLTHSISMDFSLRWGGRHFSILKLAMQPRVVVNLSHGISLKRLLYTTNEKTRLHTDRVRYRSQERRRYRGLIASSDIDSYVMAAMYYPLNHRQVWITGLPRNDFLLKDESDLPRYLRRSVDAIRDIKKGRRLVLYAPTYRQTDVSKASRYYQFSDEEVERLKSVLRQHNAVLGYRPHYFRNSDSFFNLDRYIDGDLIVDLSQSAIPEISAAIRECDVLVTDYSSVYVDALYLNKPALCFAYDLDHYNDQQDGLLYDMSLVFPGPILREFPAVIEAISGVLSAPEGSSAQRQEAARKIFFKFNDDANSQRVFDCIARALAD